MKYFDAHLHVVSPDILLNAQGQGVRRFIVNATSPADWDQVDRLSKSVLGVYYCYGVHPWYVGNAPDDWAIRLEERLKSDQNAMVGEIGLDKMRPAYEKQKQFFLRQLQLAEKYDRAVHVHCVRAWDDILAFLSEFRDLSVLFHRFSGDEIVVQKCRFLNAYFSVLNAASIRVIPDNRLLVESDAPDGLDSPEKIPALVRQLQLDPDYLDQNFDRFFYDR